MIIFDYGHTLIYEEKSDYIKGNAEVLKYAIKNPRGITGEDLQNKADEILYEIRKNNNILEIHNFNFSRLLFELFDVEFSITPIEIEKILWDNAAPGSLMPGIETLIDYINERGIRSGVLSNISFSEESLIERINNALPNNKFEFIIASSAYCFRKPHKFIFEIALNKAKLSPDEIWFCGDNTAADIVGASNAGMFPVWYDNPLECHYRWKPNETPTCEHLHIHEWVELIYILNNPRNN